MQAGDSPCEEQNWSSQPKEHRSGRPRATSSRRSSRKTTEGRRHASDARDPECDSPEPEGGSATGVERPVRRTRSTTAGSGGSRRRHTRRPPPIDICKAESEMEDIFARLEERLRLANANLESQQLISVGDRPDPGQGSLDVLGLPPPHTSFQNPDSCTGSGRLMLPLAPPAGRPPSHQSRGSRQRRPSFAEEAFNALANAPSYTAMVAVAAAEAAEARAASEAVPYLRQSYEPQPQPQPLPQPHPQPFYPPTSPPVVEAESSGAAPGRPPPLPVSRAPDNGGRRFASVRWPAAQTFGRRKNQIDDSLAKLEAKLNVASENCAHLLLGQEGETSGSGSIIGHSEGTSTASTASSNRRWSLRSPGGSGGIGITGKVQAKLTKVGRRLQDVLHPKREAPPQSEETLLVL